MQLIYLFSGLYTAVYVLTIYPEMFRVVCEQIKLTFSIH